MEICRIEKQTKSNKNLLQVTVYAFSIENFRRGEDEVNALLQLAKEKEETFNQFERGAKAGRGGTWGLTQP